MTSDERLIKLETRFEEHEKQTGEKFNEYDRKIESIEKLTIETHDLTSSVKQLAEGMTELKTDVKETKDKIEALENKPGEASKKILVWLGTMLGSAFVGYMLSLLSQALV